MHCPSYLVEAGSLFNVYTTSIQRLYYNVYSNSLRQKLMIFISNIQSSAICLFKISIWDKSTSFLIMNI